MFSSIDPVAARRLLNDMFVDDITSGGDDMEVARFKGTEEQDTLACDGTMSQILRGGGFSLKAIALTGESDDRALAKLSSAVLGLSYSTSQDTLAVKFCVNVSPRRRGSPTAPDISVDTLDKLYSAKLTRKILLGVTNSQFDMLGIASPITIKLKSAMRDSFIKENGLDWDSILPDNK